MSLASAAGILACPHCHQPLTDAGGRFACPSGHSFDVARQGHLNLLTTAQPAHADTAAMVAARDRLLSSGAYDILTAALVAAVDSPGVIVEVGAGTGHHLAACLDATPAALGLATDISVAAVRRAARVHDRMAAVVADTWRFVPVLDATVDVVMSVFAPRNPSEFARILRPGGRLVVAHAGTGHLAQLRERYHLLDVGAGKDAKLAADLAGFEPLGSTGVHGDVDLDAAQVGDAIAMGPNAFHTVPAEVGPARVTLDVAVSVWRRPAQVRAV